MIPISYEDLIEGQFYITYRSKSNFEPNRKFRSVGIELMRRQGTANIDFIITKTVAYRISELDNFYVDEAVYEDIITVKTMDHIHNCLFFELTDVELGKALIDFI